MIERFPSMLRLISSAAEKISRITDHNQKNIEPINRNQLAEALRHCEGLSVPEKWAILEGREGCPTFTEIKWDPNYPPYNGFFNLGTSPDVNDHLSK